MKLVKDWFDTLIKTQDYKVTQIPFSDMKKWGMESGTGNIVHESGKFFTIHGLRIQTNFGNVSDWSQPIIHQPEIGILGIIKQYIDGEYKYLLQAKIEPGNIIPFQLSPTVQATESNYKRVHKGKPTLYIDNFLDKARGKTLHDHLQVEQGGRFYKKRNRNIVVEGIGDIEPSNSHRWFTKEEISEAINVDDLVNMDCRSVLFSLLEEREYDYPLITDDGVVNFLTQLKWLYKIYSDTIPLNSLKTWSANEYEIESDSGLFYSIMAIRVTADREVASWDQPIVKDTDLGIIGCITAYINDTLHFLVQGRVEVGYIDGVCLAPTIQLSKFEKRLASGYTMPPYTDIFLDESIGDITYDTIQSEEGGRFYQFRERYVVKQIDNYKDITLQDNYTWVSYNQLVKFTKLGFSNIELRSLVTCLELSKNK